MRSQRWELRFTRCSAKAGYMFGDASTCSSTVLCWISCTRRCLGSYSPCWVRHRKSTVCGRVASMVLACVNVQLVLYSYATWYCSDHCMCLQIVMHIRHYTRPLFQVRPN